MVMCRYGMDGTVMCRYGMDGTVMCRYGMDGMVMCRYGMDGMETVGLLKQKPVYRSLLRFDRFDEDEANLLPASPTRIQCGRCGMNPTDATVCREYNSILKPLYVSLFEKARQMSKRR